jgi:hypothetical protein
LNSKALQLTYPGATLKAGDFSGEWVFNRQELTFLPSPTDFFITASYFVSGSIDPGAQLLMLQQWDSPYHWVSIGAPFGAAGQLTLSSSIPSTGAAMTAAQPASRWFCLTLHVSQSFVGLSIDGTMMSGQTLQSTTVGGFAPTPRWGKLHVGYVVQNPPLTIAAAKDVWIDDIVVSTSPPDCQK